MQHVGIGTKVGYGEVQENWTAINARPAPGGAERLYLFLCILFIF